MNYLTKMLLVSALGLSSVHVQAQYETAVFDYQNSYFNNGQALKAEQNLMISGNISRKVERVEVSLYSAKGNHRKPLYVGSWKRAYGNTQETFNMPFNYKLKGDANYDVVVDYYRTIGKEEKDALRKSIYDAVDAYLTQSFATNGKTVKLINSMDAVMSDINTIVKDAFFYYRNDSEVVFPGFSDVVKRSISSMMGRKLKYGEAAALNDDKQAARAELYQKRLTELQGVAHNEIDQVLNTELLIRSDSRQAADYPTEHTRNELSVNVGYGATYLSGNLNNLDYARAPYAGLSFPLGNGALSSRFWSNSSISVGAYFNNFKDKNDNTLTGPIFGRPYYAAYGYRMFRFLRLNAGATFLQSDAANNGIGNLNAKGIQVRPFIGISAEIRLWMGLGDRR